MCPHRVSLFVSSSNLILSFYSAPYLVYTHSDVPEPSPVVHQMRASASLCFSASSWYYQKILRLGTQRPTKRIPQRPDQTEIQQVNDIKYKPFEVAIVFLKTSVRELKTHVVFAEWPLYRTPFKPHTPFQKVQYIFL